MLWTKQIIDVDCNKLQLKSKQELFPYKLKQVSEFLLELSKPKYGETNDISNWLAHKPWKSKVNKKNKNKNKP